MTKPILKTVENARKEIEQGLSEWPHSVLTRHEMEKEVFGYENRSQWKIRNDSPFSRILGTVVTMGIVKELRLDFPARAHIRYAFREPSILEIVQSIDRCGYFSHFSAMSILGLTDQSPKTIYFNIEQNQAPGGGQLDQKAIDRTFARPCRASHNTAEFNENRITVLNGGNTDCAGVSDHKVNKKRTVRVAGIERTLIDLAVRPIYSGGVFEVARAYEAAKEKVSVTKLVQTLKRINYTYPYHQVIGYYLERAKYTSIDVELLRDFPMEFDFYLDYKMRQTEFSPRWRLHIPKGF